jgi:ubiquinone/menaquinone biosynthesis C-methylase UbiE
MSITEIPVNQNAAEFVPDKDDVFGRIATRYDMLCDIFSLGIHRLWKRRAAQRIASEEWGTLLDGATAATTGSGLPFVHGRSSTSLYA